MRREHIITRTTNKSSSSPVAPRRDSLVAVLVLVLQAMVVPTVQAGPSDATLHPFPTAQWSDAELAAYAAGLDGPASDPLIQERLARLATMDPAFQATVHAALLAVAEARWHQETAAAGLDAAARQVLRTSSPLDMDAPWSTAASNLDPQAAEEGLLALYRTALLATNILGPGSAPSFSAQVLAALDVEPGPIPETTADLVDLLGATGPDAETLRLLPPQVQDAIASIIQASGRIDQAADAKTALADLARSIEAARPVFDQWTVAAAATRLADVLDQDALSFPDPDAATPLLPLTSTSATDPDPADTPSLAAALELLAAALGTDPAPLQDPSTLAHLARIPEQQAQAIARAATAAAGHIEAQRTLSATPAPPALTTGTDTLRAWSTTFQTGDPLPLEAMSALPYLQSSLAAYDAFQELLESVSDLVPAMSMASSGPAPAPVDCTIAPIRLAPLLNLDPCGEDSVWTEQAVLDLDLGGDDIYLHRAGGAPFGMPSGLDMDGARNLSIPISILVDFGGNDTYDAGNTPCAQGAACSDHPSGDDIRQIRPVGILIDWSDGGTASTNTFRAGDRSQGHASGRDTPRPSPDPEAYSFEYGVLVERTGNHSILHSSYLAGTGSQGSISSPDGSTEHGGIGVLLRLVGNDSHSTSTMQAGDRSQGSHSGAAPIQGQGRAVLLGMLFNAGGERTEHHDQYTAGGSSQGAATRPLPAAANGASALFLDVAGPGSRSNDTYAAGPGSRGASPAAAPDVVHQHGIFIDALVNDPGRADARTDGALTIEAHRLVGASNDAYDQVDEGNGYLSGLFVDLSGTDTYADPEMGDDRTWIRPGAQAPNGIDAAALESRDGDLFPDEVESAWDDLLALWSADPDSDAVSPAPWNPRILIDALGVPLDLDEGYALVVSVGGDDRYGPGFSAGTLIDLAGNDTYLGRAGAASLVPRDYAGDRSTEAVSAVPVSAPQGTVPPLQSIDDPDQDGPDPDPTARAVSLLLDLQGDDVYSTDLDGAQGHGSGGGVGILLDLSGSDLYEAPSDAQGSARAGGIGILVDAGAGGTNTFRSGPRSQGRSDGAGSVALLLALGDHNRFDDGGPAGSRVRVDDQGPGAGSSVNLDGDGTTNRPPTIGRVTGPGGPLMAGATYRFTAEVDDVDGDDVRTCWRFTGWPLDEEVCDVVLGGNGTAVIDQTWTDVPTDGRTGPGPLASQVLVRAVDNGGLQAQTELAAAMVQNPVPELLGDVRGPSQLTVLDAQGTAPAAFQLPFAPAEDLSPARYRVDWGDGTPVQVVPASSIDWAAARHGATARTDVNNGDTMVCTLLGNAAEDAIDHDNRTAVGVKVGTGCPNPALWFDMAGVRTIERVDLNVSIDGALLEAPLVVEGVTEDHELVLIGTARVTAHEQFPSFRAPGDHLSFTLDPPRELRSLQVRLGLIPDLPNDASATVSVFDAEARGQGIEHAFRGSGTFRPDVEIWDAYGGRNGTEAFPVRVDAATGSAELPFELISFSTRGPARTATVAADTTYTLVLKAASTAPTTALLCILWDDGTNSTCTAPAPGSYHAFRHAWSTDGVRHDLVASYVPPGQAPMLVPLMQVTTERMVDVFLDGPAPDDPTEEVTIRSDPGWSVPIALLAPLDRATFYSGTPYPLTIDGGGNDRYSGRVASTWDPSVQTSWVGTGPSPPVSPTLGRPSLLIDVQGDDDYLSDGGATQGFGAFGAAALLADLQGDDWYIADGMAQGVGVGHGAGMLLDLGGDDAFNGLLPGSPQVANGSAWTLDPWSDRSDIVPGPIPRPPLARNQGTLLQGAGLEGLGILVTHGGTDLFDAGDASQGHGRHALASLQEYVVPDPSCIAAETPSVASEEAFDEAPLCALGLRDWQSNDFLPAPAPQDAEAFVELASSRQRFGPAAGFFLTTDGTDLLRAGRDSQGAGGPGGRGTLLDADGGILAAADAEAQGYGESGFGVFASRGNVHLVMGTTGQGTTAVNGSNPEGYPTGVGALVVPGEENRISCRDGCGEATWIPQSPPVPSLQWGNPPADASGADRLEITLTAAAAAGAVPLEIIPVVTVHPWNAQGVCEDDAPVVAGPIRLPPVQGSGSHGIVLDFAASWIDGPVIPNGCLVVSAFARQLSPVSAWSLATTPPVRVARAPNVVPTQPIIHASNDPFEVKLLFTEPASAVVPTPRAEVRLVPQGSPLPTGSGFTPPSTWAAGAEGLVWTGLLGPGHGLGAPGTYLLAHRWDWGFGGFGEWRFVEGVIVEYDTQPARILDLVAPEWASLDQGFILHGNASDASGVDSIRFQMVHEGVGVLGATGSFVEAELVPTTQQRSSWTAWFRPQSSRADGSPFHGGTVHLLAQTVDGSGQTSPWQGVATVQVDGAAPHVLSVATSDGMATNRSYPIPLLVTIQDGLDASCQGASCTPGGGVWPEDVHLTLHAPDGRIMTPPLSLDGTETEGTVRFDWIGDDGPPEGNYTSVVSARDALGNLQLLNPGPGIIIDRSAPEILSAATSAGTAPLVAGTPWFVQAQVVDHGSPPAGLASVKLRINGTSFSMDTVDTVGLAHQVVLPTPAPGPTRQTIPFEIIAMDRAGNLRSWSSSLDTLPAGDLLHNVSLQVRAASATVTFVSEVDLQAVWLNATRMGVGTVAGTFDSAMDPARVVFDGLAPDTRYTFRLVFAGPDGSPVTWTTVATTLPTNPVGLALDLPTDGEVRSGTVRITGSSEVDQATPVEIRLHQGDADGPVLASASNAHGAGPAPFSLAFDSSPFVARQTLRLSVAVDNGADLSIVPFDLEVDNSPPDASVTLEGPDPVDGWYGGTMTVHAHAVDDTLPTSSRFAVDGLDFRTASLPIVSTGVHEVLLRIEDAAIPPNPTFLPLKVAIDRLQPSVSLTTAIPGSTTNATNTSLEISATDAHSGLESMRVWNGTAWSLWQEPAVHHDVTLPSDDGDMFLQAEVRDAVGNVGRATLPLRIDRTPPRLVDVQWTGDGNGTAADAVVFATDADVAGHAGSGVTRMRIRGPLDTGFGPWRPMTGLDVVQFSSLGPSWFQLADAVGNVAGPFSVPAPPNGDPDQAGPAVAGDGFTRFAHPLIDPPSGDATTMFTFRIQVRDLQGSAPDAVWFEDQDGRRLDMMSTTTDDQGTWFQVTVQRPATRLDAPVLHRFVAHYGERTVNTDWMPGPLVTAGGAMDPAVDSDTPERGIPTVSPFLAIAAMICLAWRTRK